MPAAEQESFNSSLRQLHLLSGIVTRPHGPYDPSGRASGCISVTCVPHLVPGSISAGQLVLSGSAVAVSATLLPPLQLLLGASKIQSDRQPYKAKEQAAAAEHHHISLSDRTLEALLAALLCSQ